jgi:hypothetical protein
VTSQREIARRANALVDQFANRLPEETLAGLGLMSEGGEYGELVIELAATLAKARTLVSRQEQRELRALLEATEMPTEPVDRLVIND